MISTYAGEFPEDKTKRWDAKANKYIEIKRAGTANAQ